MGRRAALLLALLAVLATGLWLGRGATPKAPPASSTTDESVAQPVAAEIRSQVRGRAAKPPDAKTLEAARWWIPDAQLLSCGPYALHTDTTDPRLHTACDLLATDLDTVYTERFGVRPIGEPAEAIVLFAEITPFREVARETGLATGYAGFARGDRGLAIFHASGQPLDVFLETLAHELAHLVGRRALGPALPPWLSEGLATEIGSMASVSGFGPPRSTPGNDVRARRLREAYASGRAGTLERLAGLERGAFDRATVSFDYEQSALFVRFLLTEPDLAPRFRAFLGQVAADGPTHASALREALATPWTELDTRFAAWIATR